MTLPWVKKSIASSLQHDSISNPFPWWCLNEETEWTQTVQNVTEHKEIEKDIPNRRPTEIVPFDQTTIRNIVETNTQKLNLISFPYRVIFTKRSKYKLGLGTRSIKLRKKKASTRPRKHTKSTAKPNTRMVKPTSSKKKLAAVYSTHRILKREITTPKTSEESHKGNGVHFRPMKSVNQPTAMSSALPSSGIAKSTTYSDSLLSTVMVIETLASTTEATVYSTEVPETIMSANTTLKELVIPDTEPMAEDSSTEALVKATDLSKASKTSTAKMGTSLYTRIYRKPETVSTTEKYTRRLETKQGRITRVANDNKSPSNPDMGKNSRRHPQETLLDQLARVIRDQLQYLTISSSSDKPTNLTLAIQIAPVTNGKPEKGEPSGNQRNNKGVVTCMEWESDNSAVALLPGSEKIQQFSFNTLECNEELDEPSKAEKLTGEIAAAGSRGNNTGVLVFLALLAVSFILISAVLFYKLKKKNQELQEEIESREKEKKSVAMSARLQLEDLDTDECYQGYSGDARTNYNNNNDMQTRVNTLGLHNMSKNDLLPSIITTRGKVFPK